MTDLLDLVYDAHGGLERWQRLTEVRFTGSAGGMLPWPRPDFLADMAVTIDTRAERAEIRPFGAPDRHARFTPDHVEIVDEHGAVLAEHHEPRRVFDGHPAGELWSEVQAAYFGGYAFWTYLMIPFLLTWDGIQSTEIEPWQENGETWRRLRVEFPDHIATHNSVQTLYFGAENHLLRRHDYSPDVLGNPLTAHYTGDYRTYDGFAFPTRRRVKRRQPDNTTFGETIINLDIHSVHCAEGARP